MLVLFGEVEDIAIKSTKKKCFALVIMASKDAVVAATGTVCSNLSNQLLVVPLYKAMAMEFPSAEKSAEKEQLSNLVWPGYQAYEDAVMQKLKKAAKNQK